MNISVIIAIVIFLIGGGFLLIRKVIKDVGELIEEIRDAKKAESPGGESINSQEWDAIIDSGKDAFTSVWKLLARVFNMDWKKKRRFKDLVNKAKNK